MLILIAISGALGIWLIYTALTHDYIAHSGADHENLSKAVSRVRMEGGIHISSFATVPFLDRAVRPLVEPAAELLGHLLRREEQDEKRLAQAGHPKRYRTVYDLYAWKVLSAVTLFVAGIANSLISGIGFLPVALVLGVIGLFLPDYHLNQLIRKRREALRTEMAFVLHRMVIYIEADNSMAVAIDNIVQTPGGPFIQALRGVMQDFNTGKSLQLAMRNLAAQNPGIDDVARFAELVIRADEIGQPLGEPLRNMANLMQARVESEIESQGLATSVKMVLPIGLLVLPAIGIIVMAPAVYLAAQYFFR